MQCSVWPRSHSPVPMIFDPGQDRFRFESPSIEDIEGKTHVKVGGPEPDDAILVKNLLNLRPERADLVQCHGRIRPNGSIRRVGVADLVRPRHVNNRDTIRTLVRQRRRLGSNCLGLLCNLESLEDAVDASGLVHLL